MNHLIRPCQAKINDDASSELMGASASIGAIVRDCAGVTILSAWIFFGPLSER
jgi:hypothetical protein